MTSKKEEIVVTGVNGFVGEHLAHHLKDSGYTVHGIGREARPVDKVAPYIDNYSQADLLDKVSVEKIPLRAASAIIHLAGLASVADSFNKPDLYRAGNAEMTSNLLSSAYGQGFNGRTVVVSTGALYDTSNPGPIKEDTPTKESSPYAEGKIRAEEIAKHYREQGRDVVIARPFNHIGPGQEAGFLVPDLYEQLLVSKANNEHSILVGNLTTQRDYTDVRDIVDAYIRLATADQLQHEIYNIASGTSKLGTEILDALKAALGLDSIKTVVDSSRIRPTDAPNITGDSTRLRSELHWEPTHTIEGAISDFVARKNKN